MCVCLPFCKNLSVTYLAATFHLTLGSSPYDTNTKMTCTINWTMCSKHELPRFNNITIRSYMIVKEKNISFHFASQLSSNFRWNDNLCDLQLLTIWEKSPSNPTTGIICRVGIAHDSPLLSCEFRTSPTISSNLRESFKVHSDTPTLPRYCSYQCKKDPADKNWIKLHTESSLMTANHVLCSPQLVHWMHFGR